MDIKTFSATKLCLTILLSLSVSLLHAQVKKVKANGITLAYEFWQSS
jgi:hypothetical protein